MACAACWRGRMSAYNGIGTSSHCRWSAGSFEVGNASRYANTLSILTSSGVPLVEAMRIAAEVVSNQWLKRALGDAVRQVSEGSSLRMALGSSGHFPPMFLHMVASGESTGELDTMLRKVARFQQSEIERLTTALVRVFEPTMMVIMGAHRRHDRVGYPAAYSQHP